MSAVGSPPPDLMRTYMLRSSTPASNEKVLLYLEGMQRAPPEEEDQDAVSVHSSQAPSRAGSQRAPRSQVSRKSRSQLSRSHVADAIEEEGGVPEDIRSDVQEQSEVARTVQIESMAPQGYQEHPEEEDELLDLPEPTGPRGNGKFVSGSSWGNKGPLPDDAPGLRANGKFVSGSSWGNRGPLPGAETFQSYTVPIASAAGAQWSTPGRAAGVPLPETVGSPTTASGGVLNPFQEFGMAPYSGPEQAQQWQGAPTASNGMLSPKSSSRPMSPPKSNRTQYPPLPDSTMSPTQRTLSPGGYERDRRHTKTPSIAPSESASQVPRVRSSNSKREKEPSIKPARSEVDGRGGSGGSKGERSRVEGASNVARSQSQPGPPRSQAMSPQMNAPMSPRSQAMSARMEAPMSPRSQAMSARGMEVPMSPRSQAMSAQAMNAPMSPPPRSQASRPPGSAMMSPTPSNRPIPPSVLASAAAMYAAEPPVEAAGGDLTPTPSRPISPVHELTNEEQRLIDNYFTGGTSNPGILRQTATGGTLPVGTRTSYAPSAMAPSALEPEVMNSHYHDGELCQLLHALDQSMAEPVKKAVRKAVRARVKKLGMKYDNESIRQYRQSFHDHNPSIHVTPPPAPGPDPNALATQLAAAASMDDPPEWAKNLLENVAHLSAKVDQVDTKVDRVVELRSSRGGGGSMTDSRYGRQRGVEYAPSQSEMAPTMTQQQTVMTEMDDDMYTEPSHGGHHLHTHHPHAHLHEDDDYYDDEDAGRGTVQGDNEGDISRGGLPSDYSPGQQYLEEELYKLRVKPHTGAASQSGATHKTWEVARDDGEEFRDEADTQAAVTESGLPEIPDAHTGQMAYERSLPPVPESSVGGGGVPPQGQDDQMLAAQVWPTPAYVTEQGPPPWQRIHQRLLSWAIVWPMSELENALNSTTRGHQVDEIALSIWSTQSYKRYVRSKMTESPPERVDRLFVPPNMAEAISTAVYNGRHGDACGMLRDLWAPFGLEGMPRLMIVLAKHRNDDEHWVVHRFSLPDGSLTTYDTYPEKSLPDGRPLGWWFAIRIAWPDAIYPNPERLMQKMVRLHRPMQLGIDNSVAAAGIWRNLLMGSRAERSLDLERLRDLINQEVKNLRQRKVLGKLSVGSPRPTWEDMH